MKMSILGIEYKNIRKISELKLSFVDASGNPKVVSTNLLEVEYNKDTRVFQEYITTLSNELSFSISS